MSNPAMLVSEIFNEAGIAFNKLGELTAMLDSQAENKCTSDEVEMLRQCVQQFALDLNRISQHIKNRTISQIRKTLKKKAYEDAGLTLEMSSVPTYTPPPPPPPPVSLHQHTTIGQNADVTLNMLNATGSEVDLESLNSDIKLEFDSSNDGDMST